MSKIHSSDPVYALIDIYQAYRKLPFWDWLTGSIEERELRCKLYYWMRSVSSKIEQQLNRTEGFVTSAIHYDKSTLTVVENYARRWAREEVP